MHFCFAGNWWIRVLRENVQSTARARTERKLYRTEQNYSSNTLPIPCHLYLRALYFYSFFCFFERLWFVSFAVTPALSWLCLVSLPVSLFRRQLDEVWCRGCKLVVERRVKACRCMVISWSRKDAAVSTAAFSKRYPITRLTNLVVAREARAWQVKRIWSFRGRCASHREELSRRFIFCFFEPPRGRACIPELSGFE